MYLSSFKHGYLGYLCYISTGTVQNVYSHQNLFAVNCCKVLVFHDVFVQWICLQLKRLILIRKNVSRDISWGSSTRWRKNPPSHILLPTFFIYEFNKDFMNLNLFSRIFREKRSPKKCYAPHLGCLSPTTNNNNNRISPFVLSDPWVPPTHPKTITNKSGTRCFRISFMMRGTLEVVSTSCEGPACRWNTMASTRWEMNATLRIDVPNKSSPIFGGEKWWMNRFCNPNP